MTHTPGPLRVEIAPMTSGDPRHLLISGSRASDLAIAKLVANKPESKANAARFVATWDACDGISNEALADGVIGKMVEASTALLLWHQTGGASGNYEKHETALSETLALINGQTA